jgi:hypothetical protein
LRFFPLLRTDFSLHSEIQDTKAYIPAVIGAGICLLLLRTGVFSFFFLVPLGFVAYRFEYRIAWAASLFAILGNAILLIGSAVSQGFPVPTITWSLLHFAAVALIFAWITAPPPAIAEKVSLTIRLTTGYCLGAVVFVGYFYRTMMSPGFSEYLSQLINSLTRQNTYFDIMTVEMISQLIIDIVLRGGSLVACVLLFTLCRQVSLFFARIIPGKSRDSSEMLGVYLQRINSLEAFRVHSQIIWVFSISLLLVVLTRITGLEIPEIILWNVLILCAILYLAQGVGVFQFFLSRPTLPPFLRLLFLVMFFVLFFSPLLNTLLLVGFALLGIAENWVPLRVPKQNSPPSTPEGEV